jgi:hypothetical protein
MLPIKPERRAEKYDFVFGDAPYLFSEVTGVELSCFSVCISPCKQNRRERITVSYNYAVR